jgi:hypothetical protein
VLATTLRLWLGRRRPRTRAALLVLVLGLAAGSGPLLAWTAPSPATRPRPVAITQAAATGDRAAAWVAAQVSRGVIVSCDPAMCSALQRHGFPAGNLVMTRAGEPSPADSTLMVVTAGLQRALGRRLASVYAPVVLASFGTGTARIEIRPVAPDGPASYLRQFRADRAARKSFGTELLHNPAVRAGQPARQQLSEGDVDSRLIATIGIMAALHRVHLVSFGDASPGASPGVPLRSALLYGVTHGVTADTTLLGSLRALLLSQHPSYHPAGMRIVRLATGRSALRLWFAAPGPLGLLDASQPLVKISSP